MFEVEQNFNLTSEQQERLLDGAEFRHEKKIIDAYFDTATYVLTLKDMWLRDRDGRFELKVPADMKAESLIDQYEEIEDEAEIRRIVGLSKDGEMHDVLTENGYHAFCICTTQRKTYSKNGFTVVLDIVSYTDCDWRFQTCEVELLVETREEMPKAAQRIAEFAKAHGLKSEYLHGKALEYLMRQKPVHFDALVQAGVVKK